MTMTPPDTSHTLTVVSDAIPMFLGAPVMEPVRLSGVEGVSTLFEYELLMKTPDRLNLGASAAADLNLDDLIGTEISCRIQLDGTGSFIPGAVGVASDRLGAGVREINAIISDAEMWGEEGRHIQYRFTLRPWLYLATQGANCRIFQNKTVVEILDEVLGAYTFPVEKRLIETYPVRDTQTQFCESDFEFFSRLCQEWGISYHWSHSEGHHRLVLVDNMGAYLKMPSAAYQEIAYYPPGLKIDGEYISSFVPHHRLTAGRYTTRDYDYTRPRADLTVSRKEPRPTGQNLAEVYDFHNTAGGSHYAQPKAGTAPANEPLDEGRQLAQIRMQGLRTGGMRAKASANARGIVPGHSFVLQGHPRQTANAEYLAIETHLLIEDVAQTSQIKDAATLRRQAWRVDVTFTAHPMTEPLRPVLTQPKPRIGMQSALVVGPEGENVWTDSLGRIKVQFHWDRLGGKNQHSSCWVRVGSQWAGNQLGAVHVPRIGQEVTIDFFGDDADLPVCTGMVYNQNNLPPWALPGQSALSGFRSRELLPQGGNSSAGRSNHFLLDDTPQQIQAQLKSDHQSSSLSLGHITRIEDNGGRKDARGEGLELRTDGHAVVRAAAGMLISTEGRGNAAGHAKALDETVQRLMAGCDQHEALSDAARQAEAHREGDQDDVAQVLKRQNDAIQGRGRQGPFPELAQPQLVLASPAGIAMTTAGPTHIASEEHTALTSGGHTSVSAGRSLLVSVKEAIRMMAFKAGLKLVAAAGNIDIAALKDGIHLLAKLEITQTANRISIKAKEEVEVIGGGSFTRWDAGGITHGTNGAWVEHAASHSMTGPKSLPTPNLHFPSVFCKECMEAAMRAASRLGAPRSAD